MKKTLLAVMLIVAICIPVFANVDFKKDNLTLTTVVKVNFEGKDGLKPKSADFVGTLAYSAGEYGIFNQRFVYTHSAVDSEKKIKLQGVWDNMPWNQTGKVLDASIAFSKETGEYKPSSLTARFTYDYVKDGFGTGLADRYYWDKYDDNWIDESLYHYDASYIGFIYSFDKDPAKSAVIAGFSVQNVFDSYTPYARLRAMFHRIDDKIVVEDGEIKVGLNTNVAGMGITPYLSYQYSYNKGEDENGLYMRLVSLKYAFADVSAAYKLNIVTSLHKVDGELQFQLNEVSTYDDEALVQTSGSYEASKASMSLQGIKYVNYPTDSGIYAKFSAEGSFTQGVGPVEITVNPKMVTELHFDIKDGKINAPSFNQLFIKF